MKVLRLSALSTCRFTPHGDTPGTHFCQTLNRSQGHSAAGRIKSMKNRSNPPPHPTPGVKTATFHLWPRGTNYWLATSLQSNEPKSCPWRLTWLVSVSSEVERTGFSTELAALWFLCVKSASRLRLLWRTSRNKFRRFWFHPAVSGTDTCRWFYSSVNNRSTNTPKIRRIFKSLLRIQSSIEISLRLNPENHAVFCVVLDGTVIGRYFEHLMRFWCSFPQYEEEFNGNTVSIQIIHQKIAQHLTQKENKQLMRSREQGHGC
jgi:hypothetical protein